MPEIAFHSTLVTYGYTHSCKIRKQSHQLTFGGRATRPLLFFGGSWPLIPPESISAPVLNLPIQTLVTPKCYMHTSCISLDETSDWSETFHPGRFGSAPSPLTPLLFAAGRQEIWPASWRIDNLRCGWPDNPQSRVAAQSPPPNSGHRSRPARAGLCGGVAPPLEQALDVWWPGALLRSRSPACLQR